MLTRLCLLHKMRLSHKYSFRSKISLIIFTGFVFHFNKISAQIVIEEEPDRRYYEFATKRITKFKDMNNFRDVFHKDKYLMGKNRILGSFSYNTGRVLVTDKEGKTYGEYRQALGIYARYRFFEQFSVNATFYIDFNKKASARWTSDYSYTIGRYHWKPNKFNYGYENYLNNKYSDDLATLGEKFLEGYYFLSYGNQLSEKLRNAIKMDESTNVRFSYFVRYSIKYRDEFNVTHGGIVSGKTTLGASMRYTIYKNVYIEGGVYYYTDPVKRQPWDPDYSYGFGYFDWRSFRISLTYGNWAINRWPGTKTPYKDYGFLDGQFKIVANWIW
jgi:hypothetical protein